MDKSQAKALVDGIKKGYSVSFDDVVDTCVVLREKIVENLKPHVTFNPTMTELAAAGSDRYVDRILELKPFVTGELERRNEELAEQEKKLEENKHELAALKAKLQDLRSSYPI